MVQLIDHTEVLTQRVTTRSESIQEKAMIAPAERVNLWIRSFKKWIHILEQWQQEAQLIDRLVNLSIIGEEGSHTKLHNLRQDLRSFVVDDVKQMEIEVLDMQRNIDLLRRCVINSEAKVTQSKLKLQQLTKRFSKIKNEILRELADTYPVTIQ